MTPTSGGGVGEGACLFEHAANKAMKTKMLNRMEYLVTDRSVQIIEASLQLQNMLNNARVSSQAAVLSKSNESKAR
jgi:hypothetical protein